MSLKIGFGSGILKHGGDPNTFKMYAEGASTSDSSANVVSTAGKEYDISYDLPNGTITLDNLSFNGTSGVIIGDDEGTDETLTPILSELPYENHYVLNMGNYWEVNGGDIRNYGYVDYNSNSTLVVDTKFTQPVSNTSDGVEFFTLGSVENPTGWIDSIYESIRQPNTGTYSDYVTFNMTFRTSSGNDARISTSDPYSGHNFTRIKFTDPLGETHSYHGQPSGGYTLPIEFSSYDDWAQISVNQTGSGYSIIRHSGIGRLPDLTTTPPQKVAWLKDRENQRINVEVSSDPDHVWNAHRRYVTWNNNYYDWEWNDQTTIIQSYIDSELQGDSGYEVPTDTVSKGNIVEVARFDTAGSHAFDVPVDGDYIVLLIGGGGSGGIHLASSAPATVSQYGWGGSGGQIVQAYLKLYQGEKYDITVGAGGSSSRSSAGTSDGVAGGNTKFTSDYRRTYYEAVGGTAGAGYTTSIEGQGKPSTSGDAHDGGLELHAGCEQAFHINYVASASNDFYGTATAPGSSVTAVPGGAGFAGGGWKSWHVGTSTLPNGSPWATAGSSYNPNSYAGKYIVRHEYGLGGYGWRADSYSSGTVTSTANDGAVVLLRVNHPEERYPIIGWTLQAGGGGGAGGSFGGGNGPDGGDISVAGDILNITVSGGAGGTQPAPYNGSFRTGEAGQNSKYGNGGAGGVNSDSGNQSYGASAAIGSWGAGGGGGGAAPFSANNGGGGGKRGELYYGHTKGKTGALTVTGAGSSGTVTGGGAGQGSYFRLAVVNPAHVDIYEEMQNGTFGYDWGSTMDLGLDMKYVDGDKYTGTVAGTATSWTGSPVSISNAHYNKFLVIFKLTFVRTATAPEISEANSIFKVKNFDNNADIYSEELFTRVTSDYQYGSGDLSQIIQFRYIEIPYEDVSTHTGFRPYMYGATAGATGTWLGHTFQVYAVSSKPTVYDTSQNVQVATRTTEINRNPFGTDGNHFGQWVWAGISQYDKDSYGNLFQSACGAMPMTWRYTYVPGSSGSSIERQRNFRYPVMTSSADSLQILSAENDDNIKIGNTREEIEHIRHDVTTDLGTGTSGFCEHFYVLRGSSE